MSENGKERFILTKAYEIAYALFRLSDQITEKDFASQLRAPATALLAAAAKEDYQEAAKPLQVMECLVKFAGDVNIVGIANSDLLLKEIYVLDAAINERKNAAKTDHINLSEIFSKAEKAAEHPAKISNPANAANSQEAANEVIETAMTENEEKLGEVPANSARTVASHQQNQLTPNAAIRQTAIVDKIRQSGNCRLKDIEEILPECSERTIRYDLQSLVEKNIIERVGNGGPSVFYRVPQAV